MNKKFIVSLEVYNDTGDNVDRAKWTFNSMDDISTNDENECDYNDHVLSQLKIIIDNHFRHINNSNK